MKTNDPGPALTTLDRADPGWHHTETYRGLQYTIEFAPRVKLEIVVVGLEGGRGDCRDRRARQTGHDTSGTIFISSLDDAVKIETAKHGDDFM